MNLHTADKQDIQTQIRGVFCDAHKRMNRGESYDDILSLTFTKLSHFIPFDRIGIALLDEEGIKLSQDWVKSKVPAKHLKENFSIPLKDTSLEEIIETGRPRIINDIEVYFDTHPNSKSTDLIIKDGIRSSLTCPIIFENHPIGVIFFSSATPYSYSKEHLNFFSEISEELSIIVNQEILKRKLQH